MSRWMPTAPVMLAALALLAVCPASGRAQDLLDVFVKQSSGGDYLVRVDPDGPRVLSLRTLTPDESTWAGGAATADGRFLVATVSELQTQFPEPFNIFFLAIHDQLSGTTVRLPRDKDLPVFATHPRRTEVVWSDNVGAKTLGLGGERRLGGCGSGNVGALSADGSRAVFQCPSPFTYIVVDVDRGGVVADLGVSSGAWPLLNADGHDVYDFDGTDLRRRSVDTGGELARAAIPGEEPRTLDAFHVHPRTGKVFVLGDGIHVFDGVSLALEQSQPAPWPAFGSPSAWVFDRERPRVYAVASGAGGPAFWVLDSETLQTISTTPIPGPVAYVLLRRVPTPGAPAGLAAVVQGASVTLGWTEGRLPGQALRYVLEVGSAPGLSNIVTGLDVGLQTSFAASGVPAGCYDVRVRAGNYSGLNASSNEVVLAVP